MLKEKAAEALVAGSEYAEILKEKAAEAAEVGNEYLAEGAEKVKELAMYVLFCHIDIWIEKKICIFHI